MCFESKPAGLAVPLFEAFVEFSFVWRYANVCEEKFQFRLGQETEEIADGRISISKEKYI